jgi:repressor LexA
MDNRLGEMIATARLRAGYSARQLAEATGISHSYISQVEKGEIRRPSPRVLKRLTEVLPELDHFALLAAAGHIRRGMGAAGAQAQGRSNAGREDARRGAGRDPSGLPATVPVYATIPAGFGGTSRRVNEGDEIERVPVDGESLGLDPDAFGLRVKGDSMTGAGIMDGDLVIVSPGAPYESGDILVVRIDGEEHSLKRVILQGEMMILQPCNPAYEPRVIDTSKGDSNVHVYGKVVSCERRY